MNRAQIIRHNAKIILPQVRGKSEAARRFHYAVLQAGPLAPLRLIAEKLVQRKADEIMRGMVNSVVKEIQG